MGLNETDDLCPICQYPLTDVDGMLECQNPRFLKVAHFVLFPDDTKTGYFNFNAWLGSDKTFKAIFKRLIE